MAPARAKPSVVSAKSAMGSSSKVSTPSETTRVVGPNASIASSARASPAWYVASSVPGGKGRLSVEPRPRPPPHSSS